MNEVELKKVIAWIESGLDIFRRNEGRLNAAQIRIQSMLAVLRDEAREELEKIRRGVANLRRSVGRTENES